MNAWQQQLFDKIQEMKVVLRSNGPFFFDNGNPCSRAQYRAKMKCMAHNLTAPDDRTSEMRKLGRQASDAGGRSRSPAFGKFYNDSEGQ